MFAAGPDLALVAGAGTGKTSTLALMAASASGRGLYLAFNRTTAKDAARRFPRHVECRTAHSLAFRATGSDYHDRLNSSARIPNSRPRACSESPGTSPSIPRTACRFHALARIGGGRSLGPPIMWWVETAVPAGPAVADLDVAVGVARQGNADAFRVLYRDTQPRLLRYLRALAGDDAEDVASETWLQVARDLPRFVGDYNGFRGWVVTIARHRALDEARRRSRRPSSVPVPAGDLASLAAADDTAAGAIEAVTTDAALRLIATLPPDQAEAVLLRAVVGLDAETAGKVIGKRAGAVRSAAHRGLRTLARRLEQASEPRADGGASEGVTRPRNLALKDMR
jgi:RNA polymerase sigma-70 factor (ECF subfamily)